MQYKFFISRRAKPGWTTLLSPISCLHRQYQRCAKERGTSTLSVGFHISILTDCKIEAILFRQIRCLFSFPFNIYSLPGAPA